MVTGNIFIQQKKDSPQFKLNLDLWDSFHYFSQITLALSISSRSITTQRTHPHFPHSFSLHLLLVVNVNSFTIDFLVVSNCQNNESRQDGNWEGSRVVQSWILGRTIDDGGARKESNLAPLNFQLNCIFSFYEFLWFALPLLLKLKGQANEILNSVLMDLLFESHDSQFQLDLFNYKKASASILIDCRFTAKG